MKILKYIPLFFLIANAMAASCQETKNIEKEEKNIIFYLQKWENVKNRYEYKNVKNWEQLFETAFKKLAQYKDEDVKLRISLALGAVYHDQGKFEIALPILKNCYLKLQF